MLWWLFTTLFQQLSLRIILIGNRINVIDSAADADGAFVRIADDHYALILDEKVQNSEESRFFMVSNGFVQNRVSRRFGFESAIHFGARAV